jgi:hypothetical protein
VVEDRFGREIPGTAIELLETCVRLGIPKLVFGTEVIELDEDVRAQLEIASRVRLASTIDKLEFDGHSAFVTFKRYLTSKALSAEESMVLVSLDDQPSLAELAERIQARDHVLRLVRSLEQSRIVNLYLPEDAHVLQRLVSSRL